MRPLTPLLIAASLFALTPQSSRAQLPTCSNVMQFGVDCQIGSVEAGGIALTGFSQLFGAATSNVQYQSGGTVTITWTQTSASTSFLSLAFDVAGDGLGSISAFSSGGGTAHGSETLDLTIAALGGGTIAQGLFDQGVGTTLHGCSGVCSTATWSATHDVNGATVTSGWWTQLGGSAYDIRRRTTASATGTMVFGGYQSYDCGTWLRPRTCSYPVYYPLSATARTAERWTYLFQLQGTGPAASPPTIAVPEPRSVALLSAGLAALVIVRRRRTRLA